MSSGRMAPRLATIFVTCRAQADDTSLDGSFISKLIPAVKKNKTPNVYMQHKLHGCHGATAVKDKRILHLHKSYVTHPLVRHETWCAC